MRAHFVIAQVSATAAESGSPHRLRQSSLVSIHRASRRDRSQRMSGWLEFFVEELATQLAEVKARGEIAIRSDVIAKAHGLNVRQAAALDHLLSRGRLTLSDLEARFPETNRLPLRRDLKLMLAEDLLHEAGADPTDPNRHYLAVTRYDTKL